MLLRFSEDEARQILNLRHINLPQDTFVNRVHRGAKRTSESPAEFLHVGQGANHPKSVGAVGVRV
jgi:hypothetical protein